MLGILPPDRAFATGPKLPVFQGHMVPAVIEAGTVIDFGTVFMQGVWFHSLTLGKRPESLSVED